MTSLENSSNNDQSNLDNSDSDINNKLKKISEDLNDLNCELFQAYCQISELEIERDIWRSIAVDRLARSGDIKAETFNYIKDAMTTSKVYPRKAFERN